MHLNQETVDLYVMDKLAAPELAAVEEHLLVCQQCRSEVESVELIIRALRDAPAETVQ